MTTPIEFHAFLGPEVNGVTLASQAVLELSDPVGEVMPRNISAPGNRQRLAAELKHCRSLTSDCTLYRTISGGQGVLFDLLALGQARRVGVAKTVLHHHSYAYLNEESWLHRQAFALAGPDATHVVLAAEMGEALKGRYAIAGPIVVADNLGLIDLAEVPHHIDLADSERVSIGILANLDAAKGGVDFVQLAELLLIEFGDSLNVEIAGPIADELEPSVQALVRRFGSQVTLWGRVGGAEKAEFFSAVDLFVFPSRYRNEAQPLVLYEALLAGCHVLAYRRGAIASQLATFAQAETVATFDELLASASATVTSLSERSPAERVEQRQTAKGAVSAEQSNRVVDLRGLFDRILQP